MDDPEVKKVPPVLSPGLPPPYPSPAHGGGIG
jgi:hypothetical protein